MENSLQRSYITMDKDGDGHYDVLSACKSLSVAQMWMPVSTMLPA
ncbi:recombination factor protein RarA [Streptococcus pneumoniae 357]|nr:recombination factor protein RarA [Streptococcus pneumoniae 357]